MSNSQKIKTAAMFILVIFILPILSMCSKKKTFSEAENRSLAEKPEISLSAVKDKSYMNDLEAYISDHFTGRLSWIKMKSFTERMSGKDEINGVYITDERLIEKLPEPDKEEVEKSVEAINHFAELYDTKVYFLLAPTSAGIYRDKISKLASQEDQKSFIGSVYSRLSENVTSIDIYDTMYSARDKYIYYRNDHHWTSFGAYKAYSYAIEKLGLRAVDYSKYSVEHASSDFKGTFYSKCLYNGIKPDVIDIYSYDEGSHITGVNMNDGKEESHAGDIYFREYLKTNDKYCVFLGRNQAYMNIKTDVRNDKKILVIKDSYANSFVPFLTQNYSEISVIDLRYVKNSIKDFVNPNDYDQVLFLYNASTFSTDQNVKVAGF